MAITIKAGSNTYPLAIASATTGAVGSETPDGDVIYLYPLAGAKLNIKSMNKNRPTVGGASEYASGKRMIGFNGKVKVGAVGANSATTEMNAILDFIYDHTLQAGVSKCYLFYKNTADGQYVKLSWNSSHAHLQYIKGFFTGIPLELPAGKIYTPSIDFREATLP